MTTTTYPRDLFVKFPVWPLLVNENNIYIWIKLFIRNYITTEIMMCGDRWIVRSAPREGGEGGREGRAWLIGWCVVIWIVKNVYTNPKLSIHLNIRVNCQSNRNCKYGNRRRYSQHVKRWLRSSRCTRSSILRSCVKIYTSLHKPPTTTDDDGGESRRLQ